LLQPQQPQPGNRETYFGKHFGSRERLQQPSESLGSDSLSNFHASRYEHICTRSVAIQTDQQRKDSRKCIFQMLLHCKENKEQTGGKSSMVM
jgi:hypothetical protein